MQDDPTESNEKTAEIEINGVDHEETEDEPTTNENHVNEPKLIEKEKAIIKVVGMELSERCENGRPWTKPLPVSNSISKDTGPLTEKTPQEIILQTNVPINSRILITDAHTENVADEPSVILESKVTLNVIAPETVSSTYQYKSVIEKP